MCERERRVRCVCTLCRHRLRYVSSYVCLRQCVRSLTHACSHVCVRTHAVQTWTVTRFPAPEIMCFREGDRFFPFPLPFFSLSSPFSLFVLFAGLSMVCLTCVRASVRGCMPLCVRALTYRTPQYGATPSVPPGSRKQGRAAGGGWSVDSPALCGGFSTYICLISPSRSPPRGPPRSLRQL